MLTGYQAEPLLPFSIRIKTLGGGVSKCDPERSQITCFTPGQRAHPLREVPYDQLWPGMSNMIPNVPAEETAKEDFFKEA